MGLLLIRIPDEDDCKGCRWHTAKFETHGQLKIIEVCEIFKEKILNGKRCLLCHQNCFHVEDFPTASGY